MNGRLQFLKALNFWAGLLAWVLVGALLGWQTGPTVLAWAAIGLTQILNGVLGYTEGRMR